DVLSRPANVVALLLAAGMAAMACGPAQPASDASMQPASAPIRSDRIEVRELDEGLKLALVERHGDPKPAVALALAHDQGSWVSVALSALFERRLALRGYPTVVRQAHDMGFQLATLVTGGPDAERFVIAARASLEGPIAEND